MQLGRALKLEVCQVATFGSDGVELFHEKDTGLVFFQVHNTISFRSIP